MAGPTHGEKIDELTKVVATLAERLENVRKEVAEIHKEQDELWDKRRDDEKKLAVIEERLNELKRSGEEASRRSALYFPPLVAGIVGGILALLGQLLIRTVFG